MPEPNQHYGRCTLPPAVRKAEWDYIAQRRQAASASTESTESGDQENDQEQLEYDDYGFPKQTPPAVGLAISGGGIRSATFHLGILQELAHCGVLRCVDLMATVSGGGFIGSCLTSLMTIPPRKDKNPQLYWNAKPEFDLDDNFPLSNTKQMHHLRKHGDFLVLRSGFFRREVLRAAGALLSGVICAFATYVTGIMLLTALLMFAASVLSNFNMWEYLPTLELETIKCMYKSLRFDVLAKFAAIGGIVSVVFDFGFLITTKYVKPSVLGGVEPAKLAKIAANEFGSVSMWPSP